jgi:hypothetical protein
VYSLDLNNSPCIDLNQESCASKIYDATNRGALDVKWRELEFSLLPSSALKCVLRNAKGSRRSRGLWRSAENLRVETFGLWHSVVKFYQGVGIPQYIGEWWLAFRSMFERGTPRALDGRAVCGIPRKFERGMPTTTEFQYPPFYIDSSSLYCVINVCRVTFQILDLGAANCLGLNYTRMVSVNTPSRDTIPLT